MKKLIENGQKKVFYGALNTKEIAEMMGISVFTASKWIKVIKNELGNRIGYSYSPKQIRIIVEKYGSVYEYLG